MTIFIATFLASLLDPIAVVLCFVAGLSIRRYLVSAIVGAILFIALLAFLSTVPKIIPVLAGRIAAGAFIAAGGCFLGRKLWSKRKPA